MASAVPPPRSGSLTQDTPDTAACLQPWGSGGQLSCPDCTHVDLTHYPLSLLKQGCQHTGTHQASPAAQGDAKLQAGCRLLAALLGSRPGWPGGPQPCAKLAWHHAGLRGGGGGGAGWQGCFEGGKLPGGGSQEGTCPGQLFRQLARGSVLGKALSGQELLACIPAWQGTVRLGARAAAASHGRCSSLLHH